MAAERPDPVELLRALGADTSEFEEPWDDPLPLDPMTGPPFPVEALPGLIHAHVAALSEETQTPPDLAASVALGSLSAVAGGKFQIFYAPTNWSEPVHVMLTPTAGPGNLKSALFAKMTKPIVEWEAEQQELEAPVIAQWESRFRVLDRQLRDAENAQGKPSKDGAITNPDAIRMAALDAVHEHLKGRPVQTEVFTDDATPEAVKERLIAQRGALAVMSPESAYLNNVAGRYHDAPHLDTILNGHAGDLIKVTRKGKPTERVDRACLTMMLMLQPDVFRTLGQVDGFRQRGAAARLLPCFPADLIGSRKMVTARVPDDLVRGWDTLLRALLDIERTGEPFTITMSAGATAAFTEFRQRLEPEIKAEGLDMQGWNAKEGGTVLRLAGLIHVASNKHLDLLPIERETIIAAAEIATYFHHHARIMFRAMYGREGQSEAGALLDVLRRIGQPSITKRDLYRRVHNRAEFPTSESLSPALSVLEESAWIRLERQQPSRGRPSTLILLHPEIGCQKWQKSPRHPETATSGTFGTTFRGNGEREP